MQVNVTQSELARPKLSIGLRRAISYAIENYSEAIELDDMAAAAKLSRYNLCRRFQSECGTTPMKWLWTFRSMLAAEFIKIDPSWSLTDIAFAAGFNSSAHFSRSFKLVLKQSPSSFKTKIQSSLPEDTLKKGEFGSIFGGSLSALHHAAISALTTDSHH